jgi:hypothetical protein
VRDGHAEDPVRDGHAEDPVRNPMWDYGDVAEDDGGREHVLPTRGSFYGIMLAQAKRRLLRCIPPTKTQLRTARSVSTAACGAASRRLGQLRGGPTTSDSDGPGAGCSTVQ